MRLDRDHADQADQADLAAPAAPAAPAARADLVALAASTKGFMSDDEASELRGAAATATPGVWLEIGTYCGKSTVHLGSVAAERGSHLITLDHHHGSEENQPGWAWYDESLVDPRTGRIDTLPSLRHTLADASLETTVSVLVATTQQVAPWWRTPLTFLFLDGNHTEDVAQHDYAAFARHLLPGGILAVHDVFPDPRDGGQPPWHVVQRALREDAFTQVGAYGSLRILRRTAAAGFTRRSHCANPVSKGTVDQDAPRNS